MALVGSFGPKKSYDSRGIRPSKTPGGGVEAMVSCVTEE